MLLPVCGTARAERPDSLTNERLAQRVGTLETVVEKMKRLKVSGYIQTQWQWNEEGLPEGEQNDFSIRRGRVKIAYDNRYGEAVFQLDATEKGVRVRDAYLKLRAPRLPEVSLTAGIFNRPFGDEIAYSSAHRTSPERSRVFRTLFPKERDLGAQLTVNGPGNTVLRNFKAEGGLFAGNGSESKETDSRKDLIGHLSYAGEYRRGTYGLGGSLYSGGVKLAGEQKGWRFRDGAWQEDPRMASGTYARREYYGVDGRISVAGALGVTHIRGEYLWGMQPGAKNGSGSPTGAVTADLYMRRFSGYYVNLTQDVGRSRHSLVVKYDAYDPNIRATGDECKTEGDVAFSTLGFGWIFRANENVKITAYYDRVWNEKVRNGFISSGFGGDIRDDVFTLRVQYRF